LTLTNEHPPIIWGGASTFTITDSQYEEQGNLLFFDGTLKIGPGTFQATGGTIVFSGSAPVLQTSDSSSNVEKTEEKNTSSEASFAIFSSDLDIKDNPALEATPIVTLE
jgi:hypothetical protein